MFFVYFNAHVIAFEFCIEIGKQFIVFQESGRSVVFTDTSLFTRAWKLSSWGRGGCLSPSFPTFCHTFELSVQGGDAIIHCPKGRKWKSRVTPGFSARLRCPSRIGLIRCKHQKLLKQPCNLHRLKSFSIIFSTPNLETKRMPKIFGPRFALNALLGHLMHLGSYTKALDVPGPRMRQRQPQDSFGLIFSISLSSTCEAVLCRLCHSDV